ncbi:MAG: hypothetical protein BWY12_00310 [candidate division BRC1 bacterium ADurb.Bin183]|nr:MAG: hypothetical protein BWY12_00310 [candidate division BRC1 bacterium ADurb.Bin183]
MISYRGLLMKKHIIVIFFLAIIIAAGGCAIWGSRNPYMRPTQDDGNWLFIAQEDLPTTRTHTRHAEIFGKYVSGYNHIILKAIDTVQEHAPDGGGYFIGVKAIPAESPIGYPLKLFGLPLLNPPRTTSYCSGASYTAFIEALNQIFPDGAQKLSLERFEAMRMQEPDSGRREDGVKFWGHWNADGNGSQFALVQYSGMGREISPREARPGDFMNITWTNGGGHSVVFLGWLLDKEGNIGIAFWSSQGGTNGMCDVYSDSLKKIKAVKTVRLTKPHNLFRFNPATPVNIKVPSDPIDSKLWVP